MGSARLGCFRLDGVDQAHTPRQHQEEHHQVQVGLHEGEPGEDPADAEELADGGGLDVNNRRAQVLDAILYAFNGGVLDAYLEAVFGGNIADAVAVVEAVDNDAEGCADVADDENFAPEICKGSRARGVQGLEQRVSKHERPEHERAQDGDRQHCQKVSDFRALERLVQKTLGGLCLALVEELGLGLHDYAVVCLAEAVKAADVIFGGDLDGLRAVFRVSQQVVFINDADLACCPVLGERGGNLLGADDVGLGGCFQSLGVSFPGRFILNGGCGGGAYGAVNLLLLLLGALQVLIPCEASNNCYSKSNKEEDGLDNV